MTDPTPRRRILVACAAVLALTSGCSIVDPDAPSRAKLDSFVRQRATRAELVAALGSGYTWYAPGTQEWPALLDFLAREDERVYAPVIAAVKAKRNVMYYTTMWQQTWLFLDDSERIESYWTNSQ